MATTTEHRKQPESNIAIERRYATEGVEYRASEKPGVLGVIRGYALRFGSSYQLYDPNIGPFMEEVGRRALDGADTSDVRILFNHDSNIILGRTKAGTAKIGVDDNGMWYEVDLPDSPNGQNTRVAIERGDITQSSWGFTLKRENGDKWEVRNGMRYRTLTSIETVYDASPVTFPANPDTTAAKRSFFVGGIGQKEVRMSGQEIEDAWIMGYLIGNSAWAMEHANSMIMTINDWIERYENYQSSDQMAGDFSTITTSCKTAKSALVALIDAHTDAVKAMNASEKRTSPGQEKNSNQTHFDTETLIDIALLERQRHNHIIKTQ